MKKRIYILILVLFMATGCVCRYDLVIDDNMYKESVTIATNDSQEKNNLNRKWTIPVDKDNYYLGDENVDDTYANYIYDYQLDDNKLTFKHSFMRSDYLNSTAVALCYKTLSVSSYQKTIVLSTSNKAMCFDSYPSLSKIVVNVTISKKVISNNADKVEGNTYTWNIDRNNANNKSINLVFESNENDDTQNSTISNRIKDSKYTMYIFAGILLVIILIIYFIFNNLKNKNDDMDD